MKSETRKNSMKIFIMTLMIFSLRIQAEEGFSGKILNIVQSYWNQFVQNILSKDPIDVIKMPPLPLVENNPTSVDSLELFKDPNLEKISEESVTHYQMFYLKELYIVTKMIIPNEELMSNWISMISQGASLEGIYRSMVLDTDYRGKESYEQIQPNEKVIQFLIQIMPPYLGNAIEAQDLASTNFHSLRKAIVEMAMEVFDGYLQENRYDQLLDWYSLFSADMAKMAPDIFPQDLRKDINAMSHLKWTKTMTLPFIRSELIVKIHYVLNSLQGLEHPKEAP